MHRTLLGIIAVFAWFSPLRAEGPFVPFPVDWTVEADSPADLSCLLDAPAGNHGPVRIDDGHLVSGDGRRLRIWGVNITMAGCFPDRVHAALIARRLAQCGINGVRFHGLDSLAPGGLIDASRKDTQALRADQFERLDFFIAELKKRGIYANLNLNVFRRYKAGDQVRDPERIGLGKGLTYFDPRLIELQKDHARKLLTHRNAFTGREYRDEPAVAIVELVNENSLIESWIAGRLLGQQTTKQWGTWSDISPSYETALTELYNTWLRERLSPQQCAAMRAEAKVAADAPIPRLKPGEFAKVSKTRFQTEARFYVETEHDYFRQMQRFLREELGLKIPVVASSDHNHYFSGYPHLSSINLLDIVDGHVYWQHPDYITKDGKHAGFRIANTPMVDSPANSTIVQLARSAVAGKPYTVSEANHPFPHESACEGLPILAAYAALQDWDGIFLYTLGHKDPAAHSQAAIGHFDLYPDPVKMAQLRAGAMLFLRGDVSRATRTITRSYTAPQVLESLRLPRSERPFYSPGFDPLTPLSHAVRITSLNGPAASESAAVENSPIRSDTGELAWYSQPTGAGVVTIETARSQAILGHCKAAAKSTLNLSVQTDVPFCAVTLHSLDARPIAQSHRLLLTACARVANTGMEWDAARKTLSTWGKPPACIEPVTGAVKLRGLAGAGAITAQPLDGAGRPLGAAIRGTKSDAGWTIPLGNPPTTWYVLQAGR